MSYFVRSFSGLTVIPVSLKTCIATLADVVSLPMFWYIMRVNYMCNQCFVISEIYNTFTSPSKDKTFPQSCDLILGIKTGVFIALYSISHI